MTELDSCETALIQKRERETVFESSRIVLQKSGEQTKI
jgi:hypothetical protein